VEDKKWGAEERVLLYQVICCYFWLPTRMLALLIPADAFSLHAAMPMPGCESMTVPPTLPELSRPRLPSNVISPSRVLRSMAWGAGVTSALSYCLAGMTRRSE
jgi:hypothetical protein